MVKSSFQMLGASSHVVRIQHNIMVNRELRVLAASSPKVRIHHNIIVNWATLDASSTVKHGRFWKRSKSLCEQATALREFIIILWRIER